MKKTYSEFLLEFKEGPKETPKEHFKEIINLKYEDFIKALDKDASDPKIQGLLTAGLKDGKTDDEKMKFYQVSLPVKSLIPTQKEVDLEKSLKLPLQDTYPGQLQTIMNGDSIILRSPIVTLNRKYIIDGHHRWSQIYCLNPDATMACYNIDFNITPIEALKAIQMSIAAKIGNIPTENVTGKNLFRVTEGDIMDYVAKIIYPTCLKLLAENHRIKDDKDFTGAGKFIWDNVRTMQRDSKPIEGAPDRDFMPQTDQAPGWADELEKGNVNFLEPFEKTTDTSEGKILTYLKFKDSI